MRTDILQRSALNGWPLFTLITALTAVAIGAGLSTTGLATPQAVIDMIRLSVQLASPWIFFAFVASPLMQLFRGHPKVSPVAKWFVRNRRYFGLSFAAGFGWQFVFIIALLTLYPTHYWGGMHKASDLFLRTISYVVLIALTVTSFFPVRRRMRREHWHWLHLFGIWYFWLVIWVSYAEMAISNQATVIHWVYLDFGLLVLALRVLSYVRNLKPARG